MVDRHSPGYHVDYQRRLREANRRLREAHEDEWRRYFDEVPSVKVRAVLDPDGTAWLDSEDLEAVPAGPDGMNATAVEIELVEPFRPALTWTIHASETDEDGPTP